MGNPTILGYKPADVMTRRQWVAGMAMLGPALATSRAHGAPAALWQPGQAFDLAAADTARAVAYSRQFDGVTLLVQQSGEVVFEDYARGYGADSALNIYSGTKGLTGLYCAMLAQDGLIDLNEPVHLTIPEWRDDPLKSQIRPIDLITMTSGIVSRSQTYIHPPAQAIRQRAQYAPGVLFSYGPVPIQCLAEYITRKLRTAGVADTDPVRDLTRRLLRPLGVVPPEWKRGPNHSPCMAVDCHLTARQWAKVGKLVAQQGRWDGQQLLSPTALTQIFTPTPQNVAYGGGWWVSSYQARNRNGFELFSVDLSLLHTFWGPVLASGGMNAQRLIIFLERDLVIVRQSNKVYPRAVAERFANRFGTDIESFHDLEVVRALLPMHHDWAARQQLLQAAPKYENGQ